MADVVQRRWPIEAAPADGTVIDLFVIDERLGTSRLASACCWVEDLMVSGWKSQRVDI
jgi:hypothetical protein